MSTNPTVLLTFKDTENRLKNYGSDQDIYIGTDSSYIGYEDNNDRATPKSSNILSIKNIENNDRLGVLGISKSKMNAIILDHLDFYFKELPNTIDVNTPQKLLEITTEDKTYYTKHYRLSYRPSDNSLILDFLNVYSEYTTANQVQETSTEVLQLDDNVYKQNKWQHLIFAPYSYTLSNGKSGEFVNIYLNGKFVARFASSNNNNFPSDINAKTKFDSVLVNWINDHHFYINRLYVWYGMSIANSKKVSCIRLFDEKIIDKSILLNGNDIDIYSSLDIDPMPISEEQPTEEESTDYTPDVLLKFNDTENRLKNDGKDQNFEFLFGHNEVSYEDNYDQIISDTGNILNENTQKIGNYLDIRKSPTGSNNFEFKHLDFYFKELPNNIPSNTKRCLLMVMNYNDTNSYSYTYTLNYRPSDNCLLFEFTSYQVGVAGNIYGPTVVNTIQLEEGIYKQNQWQHLIFAPYSYKLENGDIAGFINVYLNGKLVARFISNKNTDFQTDSITQSNGFLSNWLEKTDTSVHTVRVWFDISTSVSTYSSKAMKVTYVRLFENNIIPTSDLFTNNVIDIPSLLGTTPLKPKIEPDLFLKFKDTENRLKNDGTDQSFIMNIAKQTSSGTSILNSSDTIVYEDDGPTENSGYIASIYESLEALIIRNSSSSGFSFEYLDYYFYDKGDSPEKNRTLIQFNYNIGANDNIVFEYNPSKKILNIINNNSDNTETETPIQLFYDLYEFNKWQNIGIGFYYDKINSDNKNSFYALYLNGKCIGRVAGPNNNNLTYSGIPIFKTDQKFINSIHNSNGTFSIINFILDFVHNNSKVYRIDRFSYIRLYKTSPIDLLENKNLDIDSIANNTFKFEDNVVDYIKPSFLFTFKNKNDRFKNYGTDTKNLISSGGSHLVFEKSDLATEFSNNMCGTNNLGSDKYVLAIVESYNKEIIKIGYMDFYFKEGKYLQDVYEYYFSFAKYYDENRTKYNDYYLGYNYTFKKWKEVCRDRYVEDEGIITINYENSNSNEIELSEDIVSLYQWHHFIFAPYFYFGENGNKSVYINIYIDGKFVFRLASSNDTYYTNDDKTIHNSYIADAFIQNKIADFIEFPIGAQDKYSYIRIFDKPILNNLLEIGNENLQNLDDIINIQAPKLIIIGEVNSMDYLRKNAFKRFTISQ